MTITIKTTKGLQEIEIPEGYVRIEKGLTQVGDLFLDPYDLEHGKVVFSRHAVGYRIESYRSVVFLRKETK